MKTKILLFAICFLSASLTYTQNPYQSIGKSMPKGKMLTLSNGKYQEFFPNDTIVPIGSVMFNTVTGEVVGFIKKDKMYAEYNLEPELMSRWLSPDPLGAKYTQWSPYNYTLNNPIKFIDPDGKDVIIVIWASHNGEIGHAGIATSNYKEVTEKINMNGQEVIQKKMVADGTYTYQDFWPGNRDGVGKSNFDQDVKGTYHNKKVTMSDLTNKDVTGSEGRAADGVIQLTTDMATDKIVETALGAFKENNKNYNGVKCNCSDFVEDGLEFAAGKSLPVDEKFTDKTSATTPNQIFKIAKMLPNATIVKDPGSKVNTGFIEAVTGGGATESIARRKIN